MHALAQHYPAAAICPARLWRDLIPLLPRAHQYDVFAGHFYNCLGRYVERPLRTITFLREPIARTYSHYMHVVHEPGHYFHRRALQQGSLRAMLTDPETATLLWNVQTRTLALNLNPPGVAAGLDATALDALELERQLDIAMPAPGTEHTLLTRAKAALDACVSVGLTEAASVSLQLIGRQLGWKDVRTMPRMNVRAAESRLPGEDATAAAQMLAPFNTLDRELYIYARQRFQRDLAQFRMDTPPGL
ncbi:MAG: hypothetical protein K8T26_19100 [Lentisphaerae bacterium]|nr:hypothetical protein [Lentisphaerota bacterium]